MYTSPSGKSYIGQTINEELRRKLWRSSRYHYAGNKIDRARKKYGSDSFDYKILFENVFSTKEIASIWLNIAEQYYIQLHNTVAEGYNCEGGGSGNPNHTGAINHHHGGYKLSDEVKKRIGEGSRRWQNTPEGKAKMTNARRGIIKTKGYRIEANFKPVVQLSLDGYFIQEFSSIRDAGEAIKLKSPASRANIGNTCRGNRDSAFGYKWLYKEDYYTYFLHPDKTDIPQRVQRALDSIEKRHIPKPKKKYVHKPRSKKDGSRINSFAQQIGQYDKNLQLVKVWRNGLDAAKALNIVDANIYRASRTLGMYMGYYWRKYEGQQMCSPKPKKIIKRPNAYKAVIQLDLHGNEVSTYESVNAASFAMGANNNVMLSRCLNGKAHTAFGYKWKYLKSA